MRIHKFSLAGYGNPTPPYAFVLATSEGEARDLIGKKVVNEDKPALTYHGSRPLSELNPCVLLNEFPPF